MKASRTRAETGELTLVDAQLWGQVPVETVALTPTPLAMVRKLSRLMASRTDHGAVRSLRVQAVHNGSHLAVRLGWSSEQPSTIDDLDRFADAVAVMFPLHPEASAVTMGSPGRPVNAWYWRAGDAAPFDVVAEGMGSSQRRAARETALAASSRHADGEWQVVFARPLEVDAQAVRLAPGLHTGIAFSAWDGGRSERAAHKSASMAFLDFGLDP